MEDEEETSNNHTSSAQEVKDLTMDDKPLEIEELTKTEQCVSVGAELDDPHLAGVESPLLDKGDEDEEAATEGGVLTDGTVLDDETEARVVEGCGEMSVFKVNDKQVHDSGFPNKDEEAFDTVGEEETPIADTGIDARKDMVTVNSSEDKYVLEIEDAKTEVSAASVIGVQEDGDNEAMTEGKTLADSELEMEIETAKSVDDIQMVGSELLIAAPGEGGNEVLEEGNSLAKDEMLIAAPGEGGDEAVEEGNSMAEAETLVAGREEVGDEAFEEGNFMAEAETLIAAPEEGRNDVMEEEKSMVKTLISAQEESGDEVVEEGNSMPEAEMEMETVKISDNAQMAGPESLIGSQEEEDEEAVEEENATAGTDMETEMDIAKKDGDNAQLLGTGSPILAQDYDDEELVAEDEYTTADAEMEVGIDAAEMQEGEKRSGNGGKRKRGRNSKVSGKAPMKKTIEEDVCFICFDGGDLVLCDRRLVWQVWYLICVCGFFPL